MAEATPPEGSRRLMNQITTNFLDCAESVV